MTNTPTMETAKTEITDKYFHIEDDDNTGSVSWFGKSKVTPVRADKTPWYWKRNTIIKFYDPARWWKGSIRTIRKDNKGRSRPVGFEKIATCHRKWRYRINALRKGDVSMQQLAEILDSCRAGRRCGSLACPICMRRMRRVLVSNALHGVHGLTPQFHTTQTLEEYVMVSYSDLGNVEKLRTLFLKTKRKLRRNGGVLAAWIEVSFDPFLGGFLPHLHIYSAGYTYKELKAFHPGLFLDGRRRRTKDPLNRRQIKPGDEMEAMTYVYKQFPRNEGDRKKRAANEGRYNPADAPSIEVKRLTFIGGLKAEDMVLLKGLKRDRNSTELRRTFTSQSKRKVLGN